MLFSQLVARPDGGGRGHGIEIVEFEQAGCSFVVIAADENFPQATGAIDDFIGRRSVTHNVTEVYDVIEGGGGREASLQGFKVGVNVAKQQYAQ